MARANQALSADLQTPEPLALDQVLRAARRIVATGGLVLVFSDFHTLRPESESHIRALARHNDLLLFQVADPLIRQMPDGARLPISDAQRQAELDVTTRAQREEPASDQLRRLMGLAAPRAGARR